MERCGSWLTLNFQEPLGYLASEIWKKGDNDTLSCTSGAGVIGSRVDDVVHPGYKPRCSFAVQ